MFGENPRRDMLYQPSAQLLAWTAFRRNLLLGRPSHIQTLRAFAKRVDFHGEPQVIPVIPQ